MVDDGAGGLVEGVKQCIYEDLKSRITVSLNSDNKDFERLSDFGFSSRFVIKILSTYCPNAIKNDYVGIPFGTPPNLSNVNREKDCKHYRVAWVRHRYDLRGKWHHSTIFAEYEPGQ